MPSLRTTVASVVAFMALTQLCPAPWAAIAAGAASGAVAGAVSGAVGKSKRDISRSAVYARQNAPGGVNQQDWDACVADVNAMDEPVHVSDSENGILVENLPPSCMNLAANLPGTEGAYPVVMGSSSIEYRGITDAQRDELATNLSG